MFLRKNAVLEMREFDPRSHLTSLDAINMRLSELTEAVSEIYPMRELARLKRSLYELQPTFTELIGMSHRLASGMSCMSSSTFY